MHPPKFLSGDFFTKFDPELQAYKLYRILTVEPEYNGIHISVYANLYPELPKQIEQEKLSFGIINLSASEEGAKMDLSVEQDGSLSDILSAMADKKNHFGIMHLPLSIKGFDSEALHFVEHAPLEPEELEGFATYLEGMGYKPEEIDLYVDHVVRISSDRDVFNIDKWMKRLVPVLALLCLVGFPKTIPAIGLLLLGLVSLFWWGWVVRNVHKRYSLPPGSE